MQLHRGRGEVSDCKRRCQMQGDKEAQDTPLLSRTCQSPARSPYSQLSSGYNAAQWLS